MPKVFVAYLLTAFVAFANGLAGPFMLDDHAFFTPQIKDARQLPQHFIPKAYKDQVNRNVPHGQPNFYYRPFAKILPSISYALFGAKTFFYHLLNLALFVVAGFLLFRFLLVTGILGHRGAFLTGLLYIIHPINGVVVNYITASVFSVQVVFMLMSIICLLVRQGPGAPASQKTKILGSGTQGAGAPKRWGSIAFFILALFCHETAILLPVYAVIVLIMSGPPEEQSTKIRSALKRTWHLWVTSLIWLTFRFFYASLGDGLVAKFARFDMNVAEYAASVTKLVFWYVSKLIVPWDIVLIWATPVVRGQEILLWSSVFAVLTLMVGFRVLRSHDKALRLGILWLVAGFLPLPLMCLFQPAHGPMIEPHWFVFPVIGFFVCAGRIIERTGPAMSKGVIALILAVLLAAGWRHNHLWSDEKRYAHYWSEQAPSIKAVWFHLGEIYLKERQYSRAVGFYERSIRKTYQDYLVYQRIGLAHFNAGQWQEAWVNFMMSLELERRQPGIRERLKWIESRRSIE